MAKKQRLKHPTQPGEFWVHIDHMDNPNGDVWAIQWRMGKTLKYYTVKDFAISTKGRSPLYGVPLGTSQPKVYIRGFATHILYDGEYAFIQQK